MLLIIVWLLFTGYSFAQESVTTVPSCSNFDHVSDPCSFLLEFCPNTSGDLIDFRLFYYCTLSRSNPLMGLISFIIILSCFYVLYYSSEYYLSVPLQRLILAINMDSQVAGVTLLSLANGAPDFFTALAGASQTNGPADVGSGIPLVIGSLLGSGVFTTCFAMGCSILLARPSKESFEIREPTTHSIHSDMIDSESSHLSHVSCSHSKSISYKKFIDRSWIILPRGYFVNLLVYNLGLIILIFICVTQEIKTFYPILQYFLYLAYIIYSLLPKIISTGKKIGLKYGFLKKAVSEVEQQFSNEIPTVPTVIITSPELENEIRRSMDKQKEGSTSSNELGLPSGPQLKATPLYPGIFNTLKSLELQTEPQNPSISSSDSLESTSKKNGSVKLSHSTDFFKESTLKKSTSEKVIPQIIIPEASNTLEKELEINQEPSSSQLVASSSMSLTVPNDNSSRLRRPPPPLPRLSISLKPETATPLPLSQHLVHRTLPAIQYELAFGSSFDPSRILTYYGFQDPQTAGFFNIILPSLTPFTFNNNLTWFNRILGLVTLPFKFILMTSIAPTFEVWTQIDRGEEDWEPNEFFYRESNLLNSNIGQSATEAGNQSDCTTVGIFPSSWYLCLFSHPRALNSHRLFTLRQLVALSPQSLLNFRRFSAMTFITLGFLATLVNGVAFQTAFGVPGAIIGIFFGIVVATINYAITHFLSNTVRQYRDGLSKFLVRITQPDSNTQFSPFNLDEAFFPAVGPEPLEPNLQSEQSKLQVPSLDGLKPEYNNERENEKISPSLSFQNVCPPPPPSPMLKRVPSWATTFDALGRRSNTSGSSFRNSSASFCDLESPHKTASSISVAPNYRLQIFLKSRPDFDLRVLDLIATCNLILLVFGLAVTVMYINAISGILVSLLTYIAELLGLPSLLIGMTVLAWGNSVSDFVSAIGMAQGGHPKIALTSTLAGPIFNLVLTFGTSLVNLLVEFPSISIPTLPPITFVAIGFLISNATMILVGALPSKAGRRPGLSYLPFFQISNFILFVVTVTVVQIFAKL